MLEKSSDWKMREKDIQVFQALLKAGLWEQEIMLSQYSPIDYSVLYQLADDQSVVGLVAAGLEHVTDIKVLKQEALPFLKKVYSLEGRNSSMNQFIEMIVGKMRNVGIYMLLVKGQGIGQCYERPLWRSAGDIDFFFDSNNYQKAKGFLLPLSVSSQLEEEYTLHLGMTIEHWTVELHGTLRCGLSPIIDRGIDDIQRDTFVNGSVRTWRNGNTDIFLPGADNDVLIIFTHVLKHFYKGGIGLRQICDWCRLLWTYQDSIDKSLLEKRLHSMRLISEWKAFAAFAVDYLGMPVKAMPLYDSRSKWACKAERIWKFVLMVGNFGHKRDMSYYEKYPYLVRKTISLARRVGDLWRHAFIFPLDSLRFLPAIVFHGLSSAARGE